MQANVALVIWDGGMVEVGDGGSPRREMALEVGGVLTKKEAENLGNQMLALVGAPKVSHAIEGLPTGEGGPAAPPYVVGQSLLGDQIRSLSYTTDATGKVQVIPELRSALDVETAKLQRTIDRTAAAHGDGSNAARPVTPGGVGGSGTRLYEIPPWSMHGPLSFQVGAISPAYTPTRPINLTHVIAHLNVPSSSGDVGVAMLVNGTAAGFIVFPAGITSIGVDMATTLLLSTDYISWTITTAGTGSETLTIQVRATIA